MKKYGFVLLEVMTAVVILSTLMVVSTQVWQSLAQNRQQQDWVDDADIIRHASVDYWLKQGQPPTQLADIFTASQLSSLAMPWQRQWSFIENGQWLELTVTAPSLADATWLAGQIAGAFTQAEKLIVPIWQPSATTATDQLLHRISILDKPELNSMQANLNMAYHAIDDVGSLNATNVNAASVQALAITSSTVRANDIDVDTLRVNDVITPTVSLSSLAYWVGQYEQLWESCKQQGKCS